MLAPLENEPDAQKIVGDNAASGRKNITQREMNAMVIIFLSKKYWQVNTEYFERANLHHRTKSACNNEE